MSDTTIIHDNRLDDLVIHKPSMIHIEDMGDFYWIGVFREDGSHVSLRCENVVIEE